MKIVKIKKIEDCFDGSMIFEYFLSNKVDEEYMKIIGKLGKLSYFSGFSKPFYKIISTDDLQIKGIVGEKNFQVIFPRIDKLKKKEKFDIYLMRVQNKKNYNSGSL